MENFGTLEKECLTQLVMFAEEWRTRKRGEGQRGDGGGGK